MNLKVDISGVVNLNLTYAGSPRLTVSVDAPNLGISVYNGVSYNDWFLPSYDELTSFKDLELLGIGGLAGEYWSSSEINATSALKYNMTTGVGVGEAKSSLKKVRAIRSFTDKAGAYIVGDSGPAGGWISYIDGTTYYECASSDQSAGKAWSNITNTAIGTTSSDAGEGQNNTTEIIAQAGHTDSAAKLCDDLIINN